ncbi:hypothetical protein [Natranaerofaba carboxydovora]|uniref:GltB/FmdC/FwdC-like GXGXG domain-containing protein n=1 Tax=Natranaerofaba carboxydovora TaxID=2742683 RepID=UPI001F147AEA|nr:hypothetical protein [Natranaerofaba carboxydovora]UMZ73819.1 Ferredoxin-dependent glutamate synthase 2 [Natranaerofaba carboxydovora]
MSNNLTSEKSMLICGKDKNYKDLNVEIRKAVKEVNKQNIELKNIFGQRYIGAGLEGNINIKINGVPGNNLAAMCDGPKFEVFDNAQDMVGNTMNDGEIIIYGHVSDTPGIAMRGGKIFIREQAGYRVGIHMKAYKDKIPVLVVGENTGDFLGEYMAGGVLIVLGLNTPQDKSPVGDYVGTGMHGGTIYIRGHVDEDQLGKEVSKIELNDKDKKILKDNIETFCNYFDKDLNKLIDSEFIKLEPVSTRPYGRLYVS